MKGGKNSLMRGWYEGCAVVVVCFLYLWCLVTGGLWVNAFVVGLVFLVFFGGALFCGAWFVEVVLGGSSGGSLVV